MQMQMDGGYVGTVVISGLLIVFLALVLLILAVQILGKIFELINKPKTAGDPTNKPAVDVVPETQITREAPPAVEIAEEDDTEIIAVISAAVAAIAEESGKTLKIRSVRPAGRSNIGGQWAAAAVRDSMRSIYFQQS